MGRASGEAEFSSLSGSVNELFKSVYNHPHIGRHEAVSQGLADLNLGRKCQKGPSLLCLLTVRKGLSDGYGKRSWHVFTFEGRCGALGYNENEQ